MEKQKLKIQEVYYNYCEFPFYQVYVHASIILHVMGFQKPPEEDSSDIFSPIPLNKKAIPKEGIEFYIHYSETDAKIHPGRFKLTKEQGGIEEVIDEGKAFPQPERDSVPGTILIEGSGKITGRWSFYCVPNKVEGE